MLSAETRQHIHIFLKESVVKVLICGSRRISDPALISQAVLQSGMSPTHIISGGARGVDRLAGEYAASNGIAFTEYLADWDKYGKRAGFMRNCVMVGMADAVIAVWDGKSPGTKHSIDYATSQGKQVFVLRPEINKSGRQITAQRIDSIKRMMGEQASAPSKLKNSK